MTIADELPTKKPQQLKACLARYMDPQAFAEKVGKARREAMKARREIAVKRAEAAIRFFKKPENRARLDHHIARAEAQDA